MGAEALFDKRPAPLDDPTVGGMMIPLGLPDDPKFDVHEKVDRVLREKQNKDFAVALLGIACGCPTDTKEAESIADFYNTILPPKEVTKDSIHMYIKFIQQHNSDIWRR